MKIKSLLVMGILASLNFSLFADDTVSLTQIEIDKINQRVKSMDYSALMARHTQ